MLCKPERYVIGLEENIINIRIYVLYAFYLYVYGYYIVHHPPPPQTHTPRRPCRRVRTPAAPIRARIIIIIGPRSSFRFYNIT